MAGLNHKGPENKGPRSGRALGLCGGKLNENNDLGTGNGARRRNGCGEGRGKRLNVNIQLDNDGQ